MACPTWHTSRSACPSRAITPDTARRRKPEAATFGWSPGHTGACPLLQVRPAAMAALAASSAAPRPSCLPLSMGLGIVHGVAVSARGGGTHGGGTHGGGTLGGAVRGSAVGGSALGGATAVRSAARSAAAAATRPSRLQPSMGSPSVHAAAAHTWRRHAWWRGRRRGPCPRGWWQCARCCAQGARRRARRPRARQPRTTRGCTCSRPRGRSVGVGVGVVLD